MSSRGAFRGEPGQPAYGASKAGLNAFGQSLAMALAPHGIAVATGGPGFVDTDMAAGHLDGPGGEAIRAQSPFRRVAEAEEIAAGGAVPGLAAGRMGQRRHPRPQRRLLPALLRPVHQAAVEPRLAYDAANLTVTCWNPSECSMPSSMPVVFRCASASSGLCRAAVSIFCWARM